MCNFCTVEELDNCNEITTTEIAFGRIANFMKVSLYYDKLDNGDTLITIPIWGPGGDDIIDELRLPVSFCPLCGEKLNKNY